MEYTQIPGIGMKASRIGLGTWPIGGVMWGGSDDQEAIRTIHAAIDKGINVIDTAADYGLGHSEELIGEALARSGNRDRLIITAKPGLRWRGKTIYRDGRKERIIEEVEETLGRLRTDYIDVYLVHWPDPLVDMEETAEAMKRLYDDGKIRAIGVSNFTVEQMEAFRATAPLHAAEPPLSLFERDAQDEVLPWCEKEKVTTLLYSSLCRGLLSGSMTRDRKFKGDDMRGGLDPKFQEPRFGQYLAAVAQLTRLAREKYGRSMIELAVRWVLDQPGAGIALRGARHPEQLETPGKIDGWHLTKEDMLEIDLILRQTIAEPIGPDFMAPPTREDMKAMSH